MSAVSKRILSYLAKKAAHHLRRPPGLLSGNVFDVLHLRHWFSSPIPGCLSRKLSAMHLPGWMLSLHLSLGIRAPPKSSSETTYLPLSILSYPGQPRCIIKRISRNACTLSINFPRGIKYSVFTYFRRADQHYWEIQFPIKSIEKLDWRLWSPTVTHWHWYTILNHCQLVYRLRHHKVHIIKSWWQRAYWGVYWT